MFRQIIYLLASLVLVHQSVNAYMTAYLHNGDTANSNGSRPIEVDISSNWKFPDLIVDQDRWGLNCGNDAQIKSWGSACSVEDTWRDGKGCGERYVKVSGFYIPASAIGTCNIEYYADGDNAGEQTYTEIFTVKLHVHWQGPPAETIEGETYTISYAERNKTGTDAYSIAYNSKTGSICRVEADGSVTNLADGLCEVDIIATSLNLAYASKTVTKSWTITADTDRDGIKDSIDNCPSVPNVDQADYDKDSVGNKCNDAQDQDGDEISDARDLCPTIHLNDDLLAATTDPTYGFLNHTDNLAPIGAGDSCQTNSDGDSLLDYEDNCPFHDNEDQADTNGKHVDDGLPDGNGDACDFNSDSDTWYNHADNCPLLANEDQKDTDNDGVGEVCEPDTDNDGVKDAIIGQRDNCPYIPNPDQADDNRNGVGDLCEMTFADPSVVATKDCLSWENACGSLQDAIDKAHAEGLPQVYLKEGNYVLDAKITLPEGIKLIGGFKGNELAANEANPFNNVTTISAGTYKGTLIYVTGSAPLSFVDTAEIRGVTIKGSEDSALTITDAIVNIVNVKFENNQTANGSAIYALGTPKAEVDLNGVIFTNNTATATGVVYLENADLTSAKTSFMNNQGVDGAAIFATGTSVVSLDKTDVTQNTATGNGVLTSDSQHVELKVSNSTLSENKAVSGGAIYLNDAKVLTLRNMLITNNHADNGAGGAVMFAGTNNSVVAKILQSSFIGNTASKNGGALAPAIGNSLLIENVTFANNKAGVDTDANPNGFDGRGGAINVGGSQMDITLNYSTFVGNAAEGANKGGGALALNDNLGGSLTMMGNLLTGNTGANGANIFVDLVDGSKGITDLGYNYVGFNKVSGVSPANALNFAASSTVMQAKNLSDIVAIAPTKSGGDGYGSPLPMLPITKGSEARDIIAYVEGSACDSKNANNVDQRGEARPDGAKCDVGAYEYTELSCIDDVQRRQADGEAVIKYCAPGFEDIEITLGSTPAYLLLFLSLFGLGLMFRRSEKQSDK